MSLEAYKQGRITAASQDGSREFISLLACICADTTAIPPALIYKGENLQDTWFDDLQMGKDPAYFATSANGWSSNEIGKKWLVDVFDRHTKTKAGNRRRLLIVDGHSSHLNLEFINLCDKRRILVLVLPPHSTHRLQPLDVSLFSPLARYYTNGLNTFISTAYGHTNMCKRTFWGVFLPAWKQAFSASNIASGWSKTGIFPYNPQAVLSQITKPKVQTVQQAITTPLTCRTTRRFHKSYQRSPTFAKTQKLIRANERLTAKTSIYEHQLRGLEKSLQLEKRKRKKGKKLHGAEEATGGAQFWGPEEIQAAKERNATKEAEKQLIEDEKVAKKASATEKKLQKETEKAQRAIRIAEKRQALTEEKLQKAAIKQALQELKLAVTQTTQAPRKAQGVSTVPKVSKKRKLAAVLPVDDKVSAPRQKVMVSTTTRGRAILRPQRFES